jgi:hypothetical protein
VKFKPKIESITAKKLYSTLFPCKKMKKFAQRDRQDGKLKVREAPLQLGIKEEVNSKSKDG